MLSTLPYNLFALMRQLLPEELSHHRVMTIRWRLYAMAAKVVKTARQFFVEVQQKKLLTNRAGANRTEEI